LDRFWEALPHVLSEAILVCSWVVLITLWRAFAEFMAKRAAKGEGSSGERLRCPVIFWSLPCLFISIAASEILIFSGRKFFLWRSCC